MACQVCSTKYFVLRSQDTKPDLPLAHYGLMAPKNLRGLDYVTIKAISEPSIQDSDSPAASEKEGYESRKCGFCISSNTQEKR